MEKIIKILSGKGKEVSAIFFLGWFSLREASKIYSPDLPKKVRSHRTVAYYFYEFKKLGLLEEKEILKNVSRTTAAGKESIYPNKCPRYRLTLKPLYLFCKEKHDIDFTKKEEEFINNFISPPFLRDDVIPYNRMKILQDYPDDDIINAILKFYIKEMSLYGESLRIESLIKNPKKDIWKRSLNELKDIVQTLKGINIPSVSYNYVENYKKNPKLVLSVDNKFKKALGIA